MVHVYNFMGKKKKEEDEEEEPEIGNPRWTISYAVQSIIRIPNYLYPGSSTLSYLFIP
jgi:hypothetical protein